MKKCDIGVIGLGAMGRNLALNFASHEFAVAGYDQSEEAVNGLRGEAEDREVVATADPKEFVHALRSPRAILLLVPAGEAVDSVIENLRPHLSSDDILIDGGNSFFEDTERRQRQLKEGGIHLLGVGISGGAYGARHGPSIMPGGARPAYKRVAPMLEAAAAKVDDEPCVTYLGPAGAGHFVKMIHNGIEYGVMQLIAETYHLMKQGLGLGDDALHEVYAEWNEGELSSYLLEITARIFTTKDEETGKPLVDVILDVARQKGTGAWTSECAMQLQEPVPTIDLGVAMRNLSAREKERQFITRALRDGAPRTRRPDKALLGQLRQGYLAAVILTYAQGFALLQSASPEYKYHLSLEDIARIWRGGCIIRAALLEDIRAAFHVRPDLPNLLANEKLGRRVIAAQADLRRAVCAGADLGIPMPAFMVSLSYFDAFRTEWLPANLIQAQRDFFGAHTYERVDEKGRFHTAWEKI
jgi:6-phosphogluconate dehydrogenase